MRKNQKNKFIQLETKRLLLIKPDINYLYEFHQLLSDEKIASMSNWPMSQTLAQSSTALSFIIKLDFFWFIILKETNEFVGTISLDKTLVKTKKNLGYSILQKFWNNKYASEACSCLVKYFFDSLGYKKIISLTYPNNIYSYKILEKLNFKYIGIRLDFETLKKVRKYIMTRREYIC